jgi:lipopolysaccharide/colanic/teichoic acid biosynthesis glycosyltransferase
LHRVNIGRGAKLWSEWVASASVIEFVHSASDNWDAERLRASVQNRPIYLKARRITDVVLVLLISPFALAILFCAAVVTAIFMGTPVFIAQDRVGLHGCVFKLLKLRTMVSKSSDDSCSTAPDHARVTSLGKFMRRSHLDELPQLWNVLIGDMSFIGPRPEQEFLVKEYRESLENYELRHIVRPGLSGMAQVYYGYASDLSETREKLKYDLFYVQNLGWRLDFNILLRTAAIYMNPLYVR